MDAGRIKSSFARVAMHGDEVPLYFYADLFLKHPQTRTLFPVSMQAQRAHLVEALAVIVAAVDDPARLSAYVRELGRGHRKFGALAGHYEAVGASLLATFAYFCGETWDAQLAADWQEAYELIAGIMTNAAREDEQHHPAYWTGTVVRAERPAFDVTVLTVAPQPALDYQPGQSVAVEVPARPRLWRYYSMANAPRPDGTVDFHIRLIDGGAVSMALTSPDLAGTQLRLGPPSGALRLRPGSSDVLMVAGSTGLAPMKAMLEQLAGDSAPPAVHLFTGARSADGLYDAAALEKLAAGHAWLTVVPVVAAGPSPGLTGELPEVVARYRDWSGHDAYLAGPAGMVKAARAGLTSAGVPACQIHVEDFGWSEP